MVLTAGFIFDIVLLKDRMINWIRMIGNGQNTILTLKQLKKRDVA
jgi:hypothetical protein